MTDTPPLMSIGEFSAATRISVRMLRHYDSNAVLVPARVDPSSGYRRYHPDQVRVAARIRRLRDIGFGVSAIAALLAAHGTPAYRSALHLQRDVLVGDADTARQRLALLDQLLREDQTMTDITVRRGTVPARTIVTLRGTVPGYAAEGQLWARFMPELHRQGIVPVEGPGGCIEHDETYQDGDVDESVFLDVTPGTTAQPPLAVYDMPAQDTVIARVTGPYHRIGEAHSAIAEYLSRAGLHRAGGTPEGVIGKHYNVYVTDPSRVTEAEQITDVCVPVG